MNSPSGMMTSNEDDYELTKTFVKPKKVRNAEKKGRKQSQQIETTDTWAANMDKSKMRNSKNKSVLKVQEKCKRNKGKSISLSKNVSKTSIKEEKTPQKSPKQLLKP